MKLIQKLEQMWENERRYTARYVLVLTGSVFIHLVLGILFALAGRWWLAAFNCLSMVFYIVWATVFTRRRVNDIMLLGLYLDVLIHACVYNVLLGAEPAFFLYPLICIPTTFYLSGRDLKHRGTVAISAFLSAISALAVLNTLSVAPVAPFADPSFNTMFFQVNVLMSLLLLSIYACEFMTDTMSTQNSLSFHAENDQLTGLRNRYGLQKEVGRIQDTQYCVVMCDIDHFKQVNDLYGHDVGDKLLIQIGRVLQACVRREDIACRWGGEEFLLVIRSDLETARAVVERIRRKLGGIAVEAENTVVSVTMTFGIADCLEEETFSEVAKIADTNLLRGKRKGRNCVVLSRESEETPIMTPTDTQLDTSFLTDRLFTAFAATSDTTYIYVCNLTTNVSRWSRMAVDYFGLPGEFMYDAASIWMGFIHPDDRDAYSRDLEAVLSGRKHFHDISYRARNRDGEYVKLLCKGVVTEGDAEHPALFAGTITNLGVVDDAIGKVR